MIGSGTSSGGIAVKSGRGGYTVCGAGGASGGKEQGAAGAGANGYCKSPRVPFKSESAEGLDTNVESLDMVNSPFSAGADAGMSTSIANR